ncbi:MAG: response regulator [Vicingaceae bacterium]
MKILLLDDSESTNLYHKALIQELIPKSEVACFESSKQAIAYLKGDSNKGEPPNPDVIFLDLQMPQNNGFHFLDHYSKLDAKMTKNFETLVVVVSDYLDYKNLTESKSYKFLGILLDFIRKPVQKEDLINLFDEHFKA